MKLHPPSGRVGREERAAGEGKEVRAKLFNQQQLPSPETRKLVSDPPKGEG